MESGGVRWYSVARFRMDCVMETVDAVIIVSLIRHVFFALLYAADFIAHAQRWMMSKSMG